MNSAVRSMPSASASSTSASSRGVPDPAAAIAMTAESSASRTEAPPNALTRVLLRGRLELQDAPLLVVLQRLGELVERALEHLVEVVHEQVDAMVLHAPLAVVV